jgi:hypothetical protein
MYYVVKKNGNLEQVFETKKNAQTFIQNNLGTGVIETVVSLELAVKAAETFQGEN